MLYPLQLLRATGLLFAFHFRRTLFSKRALWTLIGSLVPVAISCVLLLALDSRKLNGAPALWIIWMLQVRAVVPMASLLLGAGVVADEVDDRTITYLFVRPIPRIAVLLGRWLAAVSVLFLILAPTTLLVLKLLGDVSGDRAEFALPPDAPRNILAMVLAGSLVYSALFAAIGTAFRHPILIGAGYVFAIEAVLGSLPGKNQSFTVQYYLKSYIVGDNKGIARFFEIAPEGVPAIDLASRAEAASSLWMIGLVALALGCWIVSRKQYVVPA